MSTVEARTWEEGEENSFSGETVALPQVGTRRKKAWAPSGDEDLVYQLIVFEGNTPQEAIRMTYHDYARIERPHVAAIASP